ncbi:GNAT family N-acetyltransferase [Priestia aryabhattai]|uniref:GNAT family N-acetyltransferase n=1 Tax=Priestia aryabhattai TaxID=412384 RepID=UPI003D2D41D7
MIERFSEKDIKGLLVLSKLEKWDYSEADLHTIFSTRDVFGHRNEKGDIVSSVAVVLYENQSAFIGMVIVRKDYRKQGLAGQLMKHCLQILSPEVNAYLIATKEGEHLYKKAGFKTVDYVSKYISSEYIPRAFKASGFYTRSLTRRDFKEVLKLDEAAFGDNRKLFLKSRIQQSEKAVVLQNEQNKIMGYGLAVRTPSNIVIGPVVAPHAEVAMLVIDELAKSYKEKLRIDLSSHEETLKKLVENHGFQLQNEPPVMAYGVNSLSARQGNLFAIAAQAFG